MKTLVTHHRPHLDDICGMWLLKRFLPEAKDAAVDFTSSGPSGEKDGDDPDRVLIGVGRGRFDEHKGDLGECAATLVYDFLKERVEFDDRTRAALDTLVEWVRLEDTGMLKTIEWRDYSAPVLIRWEYDRADGDSSAATEFGFRILDVLLMIRKNGAVLDADWEKRVEFDSTYGKGVGIVTDARDLETYAYDKGFDIVVFINEAGDYHNIKAPAGTDTDLTPVYEKLKEVDADADWFFHHSKKMLICGGNLAPESTPSRLGLDELLDLLK